MNILMIGDLVGTRAVARVKEVLPNFIKKENIDFVITNAENSADGMGITSKILKDLTEAGVNAITMGNHTWGKLDIFNIIDNNRLIRPANYSENVPGHGYEIFECNNKQIAVINLIGRVDMGVLSENPFLVVDEVINKIREKVDVIIVDFHAEATAEKIAMGYFLDGKVTALLGTHTHVATADEKILENGTAYITDVGMSGPEKSVIGMDINASIKRFLTSLPERYKVSDDRRIIINGCILRIDDEKCRMEKIERISM